MNAGQATVIRSDSETVIAIPAHLMSALDLHEGERVKVFVMDGGLRLVSLEPFLALRGVFANDKDFDHALRSLKQRWQAWEKPRAF